MNKNYSTKMLISHSTYRQINPLSFVVRPIDYILLGSADEGWESQPVYQVLDRERSGGKTTPLRMAATVHTAAMESYRSRDFQTALKKFKQVSDMMQDITGENEDLPSEIFIKRCNF